MSMKASTFETRSMAKESMSGPLGTDMRGNTPMMTEMGSAPWYGLMGRAILGSGSKASSMAKEG